MATQKEVSSIDEGTEKPIEPSSKSARPQRPTSLRRRSTSYFHSWERYVTNTDGEKQIIPQTPVKSAIVQQDLQVIHEETDTKKLENDKTRSDIVYPANFELYLIAISLALAVFLVALDEAIISTAIPRITDEFKSLHDIGWYGSAYLLFSCVLRPFFGKLYTLFTPKRVFLGAVAVFEIGSALCGLAPNSKVLITGRVISGIGSAGIGTGFSVLLAHAVPVHRLPIFSSAINSVYGVASVAAPLLGGVFTTQLSWRWCFLINLPFGIGAMAVIVAFIRPGKGKFRLARTPWGFMKQFDIPGLLCFLPGVSSLLIALQWGGVKYSWDNVRIIVLLVVAVLLMAAFLFGQYKFQEAALISPRIARRRSVAFGVFYAFTIGASATVCEYYLPIWFQTVKRSSPLLSGIQTLPMILGFVVFALFAGFAVAKIGYYVPFMIAGSVFLALGSGLVTTLKVTTTRLAWIVFQMLLGAGGGFGVEQPYLAAMTVLKLDDVPLGVALISFTQALGSAVSIGLAETVFNTALKAGLEAHGVSGGAKNGFSSGLPTGEGHVVDGTLLVVYNEAITSTLYIAVVTGSLAMVGAMGMEWVSVKENKVKAEDS